MSKIDEFLSQGKMHLNLGNPKEALVQYQKALEMDSQNIEANNKTGNIFGRLGKYEEAIKRYDTVLKQEPNNLLALLNKGLAQHFLGDYNGAIKNYDTVLKIKPSSITASYNKASSLVQMNQLDEAFMILEKIIKSDYSVKEKIKYDLDFQKIKTDNRFKKIVL